MLDWSHVRDRSRKNKKMQESAEVAAPLRSAPIVEPTVPHTAAAPIVDAPEVPVVAAVAADAVNANPITDGTSQIPALPLAATTASSWRFNKDNTPQLVNAMLPPREPMPDDEIVSASKQVTTSKVQTSDPGVCCACGPA
jgi:hypothetical protein